MHSHLTSTCTLSSSSLLSLFWGACGGIITVDLHKPLPCHSQPPEHTPKHWVHEAQAATLPTYFAQPSWASPLLFAATRAHPETLSSWSTSSHITHVFYLALPCHICTMQSPRRPSRCIFHPAKFRTLPMMLSLCWLPIEKHGQRHNTCRLCRLK